MSAPVSAAFGYEHSSRGRRHRNIGGWPPIQGWCRPGGRPTRGQPLPQTGRWQQSGLNASEVDNLRVGVHLLDRPEQKMVGILGNDIEDPVKEVCFMGSAQSAHPPVVRVSGRAQAELRGGEALVFDWTSLAFCCAAAGEISLRPTTLLKAQPSPAYVPLRTGDGPSVFAHRRAYPMLVGRAIQVDCRR